MKKGFQKQLSLDVVQRAKAGDTYSMGVIFHTYIDACYKLAYRITLNQSLAEDIAQEAFLKVLQNIGTYQFKGSFAGWIRTIVVNESITRLKLEKKLTHLADYDIANVECLDLFESALIINSIELDFFLGKLSEISRAVMILHEIEGYKHNEIAELFGKSESFSKMTLKRAYRELRQIIAVQENKHASM
jgi:RNA polymerase sigma-70 factor (ECF subfamily)